MSDRAALAAAARRAELFEGLLGCLALEPDGPDAYLGRSETDRHGRVFGGQAVAQALMAAARCVPGAEDAERGAERIRRAHSLHAYFLRPGDPAQPIRFEVVRLRDGRSFHARRVSAIQREGTILELLASFHVDERGYDHALPMPQVPSPESLLTPDALVRAQLGRIPPECRWAEAPRAIEVRHAVVPAYLGGEAGDAPGANWFRTPRALHDDPLLHQCLLAYATDYCFNDNALRRHGWHGPLGPPRMASIDHAVWFHAPARVDDWLLFHQESPWAGRARGFVRGSIFTRDGRHVATATQECLLRPA